MWPAGLVCFNAESWLDTGYNNTVHFQGFVAVCCLTQLPSRVRKWLRESGFLQWKHDSEKTRLPSTWVWQPLGYIMRTKCQRLQTQRTNFHDISYDTRVFFVPKRPHNCHNNTSLNISQGRLAKGSVVQRMASLWSHTPVKPGHIRGDMMDAHEEPPSK